MCVSTLSYSQLKSHVQEKIEGARDKSSYDVIVIGVGSMGSSTCYHLAKKGYKVLGLERFDIPNELGSHSGQSRIIRKAYGEASDYVPLLERAYKNWKILESETDSQIYYKTGLVYFAANNNSFLETVKQSSSEYNISVNKLTEEECVRKYPQFKLPIDFEKLEESDAGLLSPERSILLLVNQAILKGAVIKTQEQVIEWKYREGNVVVKTNRNTYKAKKLVITAGAWVSELLPGFAAKLKVTRQALAWVKPKNLEQFTLGKFPCWLLENKGFQFYGFPVLPYEKFGKPTGLKLGLHYPSGEVTNPYLVAREARESDEKILIQFLKQFIPNAYSETLEMKTCLYTNSMDKDFILDFLPGFGNGVIIAPGFSGHGFKFASVIGEVITDLIIKGSTDLPIEFLSAQRFES